MIFSNLGPSNGDLESWVKAEAAKLNQYNLDAGLMRC